MMRRTYAWLALLVAALVIMLFPLRLALALAGAEDHGLHASRASGTIWWGGLADAAIGPIQLGLVATWVDPLRLLTGRGRLSIRRLEGDAAGPLSGSIEAGLGVRRVVDVNGVVAGPATGPLPLRSVHLEGFNTTFDDGACSAASGRVRIVIGLRIAGLDLQHGLSGEASCRGEALFLPLVGQSGMEHLDISLTADRRYVAQLRIQADDPLMAAALVAGGLRPVAGGFGTTLRGSF